MITAPQAMEDPALRDYVAQLKRNHHVLSRSPGTRPGALADLCANILFSMGEMYRRGLTTVDEATDEAAKWYKLQLTYEKQEAELDTQKNVGVQVGGEKLAPQGSVFKFAEEEAQAMMERERAMQGLRAVDIAPPTNLNAMDMAVERMSEQEELSRKVVDALNAGLAKDLKNTEVIALDIRMERPGAVNVILTVNDSHHPSVSVFATVQSVLQANKAYTKVRVTVDILTQITSHFTVGG